MDGSGRTGSGRRWPAWAWVAVPLLGLSAGAFALVPAVVLYGLLCEAAGDHGGDLLGFVCGPLTFLWAGWAGWWVTVAAWRRSAPAARDSVREVDKL